MSKTNKTKNSFAVMLGELRSGHFIHELSEQMEWLIEKVRTQNGKAELSIKLLIKPRNGGAQVEVEHSVTTKEPKQASPSTFFYTTESNTLSRKDPMQQEMEFQILPPDGGEDCRRNQVADVPGLS